MSAEVRHQTVDVVLAALPTAQTRHQTVDVLLVDDEDVIPGPSGPSGPFVRTASGILRTASGILRPNTGA